MLIVSANIPGKRFIRMNIKIYYTYFKSRIEKIL